jgi:hypothetical protein
MTTPFTPVAGPASESTVAVDLVRRGLFVAPVLIAVGAIGWGSDGALSVAFAIALVFANFLVAAAIITFSARLGLGVLMAAVLIGYLFRLGVLFAAVWLVKDASWMALVPFGLTLVVTHLGLLFWETRYVSASLAFPALKPKP